MNFYMIWLIRLSLGLHLVFTGVLTAQEDQKSEPLVDTQLSAKSFFMGEPFTYSVLIDGTNKVEPPVISSVTGFRFKKVEVRALKSTEKPGYIIRYEVLPMTYGELSIPEFTFLVDGEQTLTKPFVIKVQKPAEHPGVKVKITASKSRVFVGEPFLVTFTWESRLPLNTFKAVDVKFPFSHNSMFSAIKTYDSPMGGDKGTIGLPVSNIRVICDYHFSVDNNERVEKLTFKRVVRAQAAGEFEVEPAVLLCSHIPSGKQNVRNKNDKMWTPNYPSYFDNDFFELAGDVKYQKFIAKSNSLKIKVRELPVNGRPQNFSGIVGKLSVSAKADPVVLEAGTPLHLKIKLSDYEYPAVLNMPDLSRSSSFNRNFSIPRQKSSGVYEGKDKLFTQILRPLRADVSAVAPVRISYFDPITESYGVAQSKIIPITVKPTGKVTAFDALLSSKTNLKNILIENNAGIRHNTLAVSALNRNSLYPFTIFLIVALLPPLLFIIFYFATARQRLALKDPAAAKSLYAYSHFKSGVGALSGIRGLEALTRKYFAEKLNLKADAHTGEEIVGQLKKITTLSSQDEEDLLTIYRSFGVERFSPDEQSEELKALQGKVCRAIDKLNGRIKHV